MPEPGILGEEAVPVQGRPGHVAVEPLARAGTNAAIRALNRAGLNTHDDLQRVRRLHDLTVLDPEVKKALGYSIR